MIVNLKRKMCFFVALILNFYLIINLFFSTDILLAGAVKGNNNELTLSIGFPYNYGGYDFFDAKTKYIGGESTDLRSDYVLSAAFKLKKIDFYRFFAMVDYIPTKYTDGFTEKFVNSHGEQSRNISEEIKLTTVPVLIGIEIVPSGLQFISYTGLGFGLDVGQITWKENVISTIKEPTRKGGTHYDKLSLSPAMKLYAGIEYDFDRRSGEFLIEGIITQVDVVYIFRSKEFFQDIKKQLKTGNDEALSENYSLAPGYINFNIGLVVNFNKFLSYFKSSKIK